MRRGRRPAEQSTSAKRAARPPYRVRFHRRGGQGIKTVSQVLRTAFFLEGFEVQDAPRYGAERRGAPICTYVRAARQPIQERGVITRPDLTIVGDETLIPCLPRVSRRV